MASICELPIDQNSKIDQAMQILNGLRQGQAMFQNPLTTISQTLEQSLIGAEQQILAAIAANPTVVQLNNAYAVIQAIRTGALGLNTHANGLIFGGAGVYGTGLEFLAGMAVSAICLEETLNRINDIPNPSDPCALIMSVFGTVLGQGQALLNQVLGQVGQLLAAVGSLINNAIAQVIGLVNSTLAAMTDLIANELAKITDILNLQNLFGLASFLSGLFDNQCFRLLAQAVGTPQLLSILQTSPIPGIPPTPNTIRLWS